jgi:hypothetical protein
MISKRWLPYIHIQFTLNRNSSIPLCGARIEKVLPFPALIRKTFDRINMMIFAFPDERQKARSPFGGGNGISRSWAGLGFLPSIREGRNTKKDP